MKKITIAGIGGVGGYFGGLLARHYENSESVEISFVARGQHLEAIRKSGLKVVKGEEVFIAQPHVATDRPEEIGLADLIMVCTKSYDLESMLEQLKPCVAKHTMILPLLNGVESASKIKTLFPENTVLEGCVYIVSRLTHPGVVENLGNIQSLYFGIDQRMSAQLIEYEKLFRAAGLEANVAENISTLVWEKFLFLSPIATATCYYNKSIGELLLVDENTATLGHLIEELKQLAEAKGIMLPADIIEKTMQKIKSMPYNATSSLHSDIQSNKPKNELETLIGYVVQSGKKYTLALPKYSNMYSLLVTSEL